IMVNSNPETVSTDYDTAHRLYFEPLTLEDTLNLIEHERPAGVIVQLGGQTPLKLARGLAEAGAPIWGTSPQAIDRAEDRHRFNALCDQLGLPQPRGAVATDLAGARAAAERIGYAVMVRPSYVLGGRAMEVVHDQAELDQYVGIILDTLPDNPSILIDKFLDHAIEIDVDCISDGQTTVAAGIMEHVELAGIHSGDSACVLPPVHLSPGIIQTLEDYTIKLAKGIGVVGLMNVQYAIRDGVVYVLEANPRASRTIPFVSKAIGVPLASLAALVMARRTLQELGFTQRPTPAHYSVKEVALPFIKFRGVPPLLGPEMRSTGEAMGIDRDPGLAFYKAELAVGTRLPTSGRVLIAGDDLEDIAASLTELGFQVLRDGDAGAVDLLVDTTRSPRLRRALEHGVAYMSTREAARWALDAIRALRRGCLTVQALQDINHLRQ
ncbi:MAG: ATP-grasp domain-containing protein, partial [Deinococcus sp.]|nr:ATP-grasp domain-containing protein [Deinococcus sp.]